MEEKTRWTPTQKRIVVLPGKLALRLRTPTLRMRKMELFINLFDRYLIQVEPGGEKEPYEVIILLGDKEPY